jgi:hypothetical protein
MTKRLYTLILLPSLSLALFLWELMRSHEYESLGLPLMLTVPAMVVVLLPAFWWLYSVFLTRFAGINRDRALVLDLVSYLPLVLLLLYFLPASSDVLHIGTILFFTSLACVASWKAGILLYYRRSTLREVFSRPYLALGLIIGVAAILRVSLIAANRFHGDEALYCHWALLIASGKDVFLRYGLVVDKPPVFLYTVAFFFKVFGNTETAARLPNVVASLAGIAIVYEIALELFDRRVAMLSAIFLTFSPFDIQFAPTAFTDPLMVTLALASCLLALKGRHLPAGIAMGLAVMTKPTAVIFAPLAILFAALPLIKKAQGRRLGRATLHLALGFGAVVLAVVAWDLVIRINCVNFLSASAARYGGLRVAPLERLLPRLQGWVGHLQYLTGSRVLNIILVVGTLCLLAYGLWRRRVRKGWLFDWVLAGFCLYFVAIHTVLTFSVWDRYMLGLASVVAILLSRVVLLPRDVLARREGSDQAQVAYLVMLGLLLVAAIRHPTQVALRYGFPVGGDHGSFQGIDDVANYFKGNAPEGSIVFHKWLGWHYSYYLFDVPLDFYYYPSFEFVLDTARQLSHLKKYIVFPSWTDSSGLSSFLEDNEWEMRELYRTYRPNGTVSFTIYRIQPLGQ